MAWTGGVLQTLSHAFAKAAMFMAAGLIAEALGHDRIAELGGIGRALPMTVFAFGLAGLSLMGLPPSGGFVGEMAAAAGRRSKAANGGWAVVMLAGGLLAGGYVYRVHRPGAGQRRASPCNSAGAAASRGAWRWRWRSARCCSVSLPHELFGLLQIGRPLAMVALQ